mmetsp:Transcript_23066/g.55578  ORF Transcript_23066/g.55578 Transcript_23066/m.55578 type:complete len:203 (-) Transcript_23066:196-804(-)
MEPGFTSRLKIVFFLCRILIFSLLRTRVRASEVDAERTGKIASPFLRIFPSSVMEASSITTALGVLALTGSPPNGPVHSTRSIAFKSSAVRSRDREVAWSMSSSSPLRVRNHLTVGSPPINSPSAVIVEPMASLPVMCRFLTYSMPSSSDMSGSITGRRGAAIDATRTGTVTLLSRICGGLEGGAESGVGDCALLPVLLAVA